jgi:exodeoxyribonuclease VII large subunit
MRRIFTPGFLAGAAEPVLYHRAMADETPAAPGPQSNLPEYSVSDLANQLKRAVENAFPYVRVRGEISGLKFNSSGHVYFDLKDDKAVLNAVMWRTTAQRLKLRPEAGLEVICTGRVSTYPASSRYQLIVDRMELVSEREMARAVGLFRAAGIRAEGAAASALALLPRLVDVAGPIVLIVTGRNIDDELHARACERPEFFPD